MQFVCIWDKRVSNEHFNRLDDNLMAKVSDFGLARKVSDTENRPEQALPVRWMSVESIEHDVFTPQSDVVVNFEHFREVHRDCLQCVCHILFA